MIQVKQIKAAYFPVWKVPPDIEAAMSDACRQSHGPNDLVVVGYVIAEREPNSSFVFPIHRDATGIYPAWDVDQMGGSYECGRAELVKASLPADTPINGWVVDNARIYQLRQWAVTSGLRSLVYTPDSDDHDLIDRPLVVVRGIVPTDDRPILLIEGNGAPLGWFD